MQPEILTRDVLAAAAMVIQLDTYARASEILRVTGKHHVVRPARAGPAAHRKYWAILLAPGDIGERGKNFDQDDAVIVGDRRNPWVADVLREVFRTKDDDVLFGHLTPHSYEENMRWGVKQLDLCGLVLTPHVI